jgi:hypothetical protein
MEQVGELVVVSLIEGTSNAQVLHSSGDRPLRRRGLRANLQREKFRLIALQYADCTTVGREFDLRQAAADGAEESFGEL